MSEADSVWYLRHRDGVEHGPFQLADLVTAAKAGNIAADTCVRHQVHTRAQWVFATRVQPIAQVMSRDLESSTSPAQPRSPQQSSPQPSKQPSEPAPAKRPAESRPPESSDAPASLFRGLQQSTPKPSREAAAQSSDPDELIDSVAATTTIRSHRDAAYPVPKTFVDAVQTLFLDFRFRRFVTPWIVKILWAMSLLLAFLLVAKLGHEFFIQPSMSTPSEGAGRGNWQFGPINEQPLLLMRILIFSIAALITSIIVLCIRVICEMIIVLFLAGGDVSDLRKLMKRPRP